MGAGPLLRVGQLLGEDGVQPLRRHPRSSQHPFALHGRRRTGHHDGVDVGVAAGLEQQRDIQDDDVRAVGLGLLEETDPVASHQRVDDGVEALEFVRLAEHGLAQRLAVDLAVLDHARKRRANRPDRRAALVVEGVDRRVGVVDRHARLAEHRRGRRLAHAVTTEQRDDLAGFHLKRHALEDVGVAVIGMQVDDLEHQCAPSCIGVGAACGRPR